ncbi:hypothetical protein BCT30_17300 [Enterovibrio norvegicus]|uniref:VolA/Pla-1 family phospholipase n=1 Tax=Enterovibrio norvegicus TaxID=188144 RepID=UPI000C836531|nr:VolA/Pla-1 family phospholipase [Enterovibrio norvegicus]MCC4797531.1 lipase [Enterovibrio norvegicus]PMI32918.1 hypothetical protein BCU46_22735 [Enterovibrio norvegicus]PMI33645.1 hypothetical protein BCU47_08775 [Enterovibrio norvegicus]PMN50120.1 hypothetical protein BCT30_17300 [Enterovibrio norvegicus]TKF19328.1 lipase [Enterovibrio norvegicus]
MKTKFLSLMISAALLTACNDSSLSGEPTVDPDVSASLNAPTKVNFDLLSSDLQVVTPSFLAVDSKDGTLSTDGSLGSSEYSQEIGDPTIALGKNDGWGTSVPFQITFTGNNLDSTTANQGFKLIESKDPTSSTSIDPKELIAGQDFFALTSGKMLIVYLAAPLNPASNYMFAITNELKDETGESVGTTGSYVALKDNAQPPSEALVPAQTITRSVEAEFAKIGVNSNDIVFSTWFTTASVGDVLYGAKLATAQVLNAQAQEGNASDVWQGSAVNDSLTDSDIDKVFSITAGTNATTLTSSGNAIVSLNISLPYYLSNQAASFANTAWQSGMPSLAVISSTLSSGSDADKAAVLSQLTALDITQEDLAVVATDAAKQAEVIPKLFGQTLTKADGSQLDEERLITRYSPVPKLQSVEDIPMTLIAPPACNNSEKYRAVIFQHGVTTSKDVLTANNGEVADALIDGNCVAIFAIDHPIHGERALAGGAITATVDDTDPDDAGNASYYLNLAALPVARDNLRQSVIDVVNLRASIGRVFFLLSQGRSTGTALDNLDPSKGVAFVGHSLGAMTGVNVGNIANRSVGDTQSDSLFFNMNTLALANPGAGIPYLLLNSETFGDFVKGSLLAPSSTDFNTFCSQIGQSNDAAKCFEQFEPYLLSIGQEAALQEAYTNFNSYAFAAQSILDSVDPINHAGLIDAGLPVYLASVAGDSTIPNKLDQSTTVEGSSVLEPYSPFGGTLPLIGENFLKLTTTTESKSGSILKSALLFTEGGHSSLLNADASSATTTEMQSQIASVIAGDGTILTVDDNSVLSLSQ